MTITLKNVRREDDRNCAAIVANPSSIDVQVARSSLLPGVLKALGANKDAPLPVKLFEVGGVVVIDENAGVGAKLEKIISFTLRANVWFRIVHEC